MAAMHIENGRQWVASTTREFVESSKTSTKMDKAKGDKGVKAIAELVKAVPKYQKLYSKFSIHISLTKRCMDMFNRNGLEKVCDVEQSIATGANDANKKLEVSELCKLANEILEDPDVSHADKFRLVLLLNAACDHSDAKVKKIVQNARLSSDEEETLKYLISVKNASARKKQQRVPGKDEWEFVLSRYFPCVKGMSCPARPFWLPLSALILTRFDPSYRFVRPTRCWQVGLKGISLPQQGGRVQVCQWINHSRGFQA